MPTPRLFVLLLVAVPLFALGGSVALAGLAVSVVALMAAATDWLLARDGRRVTVERVLETDKLSLAVWNPVRLVATNDSARAQRIQIRDVVPTDFDLDAEHRCSPGCTARPARSPRRPGPEPE